MSIVAVSPHLDDAALSASVALSRGGATVVTIFTALPRSDRPVTWWDRLTGAKSSLERQRERLAEYAAAMRLLSATAVHLEEPEALYREGDPDLGRVVEPLTTLMRTASEVWLPSAIGGHRDHAFARDAGLQAAIAAGHAQVTLYADYPYVITYGWPSWVSGMAGGGYLDAGYWLAEQLTSGGLDVGVLVPVVTMLSPAQRARKTEIIAAYRTQAAALRLAPEDLAADPSKLDFELAWRMRLRGLAWPDGEGRHHAPERISQTPALVERGERGGVGRPGWQRSGHLRNRGVGGDLHDRDGGLQVLPGRDELGAAATRPAAVPGIDRGQHPFYRAEYPNQRGRGLLPHARYPRQPVTGVAAQRREGGITPAGNPVATGNRRLVDDLKPADPLCRIQNGHRPRVVDQLEQVTVAGHDLNWPVGARGERADHVVGLVPGRAGRRDPGCGENLGDDRYLGVEFVGYLFGAIGVRPVLLVGGDGRYAKLRPPIDVHAGDQAARVARPHQPGDHVEQPAHRVHRSAVRSGHALGRDAVVGAEIQRRGVEQHQRGHAGHPARRPASPSRAS